MLEVVISDIQAREIL
ncbi:phosphopyruvate hydratase, partial [Chlamydia psittaci 06-1683]